MSLNAIYNFDYEFNFDNDSIIDINKFNEVYNKCTLEDQSGNRKDIIYNKCVEILTLLNIAKGIRIFSSFLNIDNKRYKVTVLNLQWSGGGVF